MRNKFGRERERESVDREGGKDGDYRGFGQAERLHSKEEKRRRRWMKQERGRDGRDKDR